MTSKECLSAKFIDLHGHKKASQSESDLSLQIYSYSPKINDLPSEGQFYSAGVHPWELDEAQKSFQEVKKLCLAEKCLMVGEAGLDRAIIDQTDFRQQEEIFKWHIKLANELRKPLIIHNVRSLSDIFRLHKENPSHTNWVLHDFNGSFHDYEECIKRGIYLSLGPRFFESSTAKIAKTIANNKLDTNYIFFETDDRNDITIQTIYQKFAKKQQISEEQLKEEIWKNLAALLGRNLMS